MQGKLFIKSFPCTLSKIFNTIYFKILNKNLKVNFYINNNSLIFKLIALYKFWSKFFCLSFVFCEDFKNNVAFFNLVT